MGSKISWKFFVDRTGRSLVSIFSDARTLPDAKKKLDEIGLTHPDDDEILSVIDMIVERENKKRTEKISRAKKTTPRSSRKKSSQDKSKKAKSIQDSASTTNTQEKPDNEKYFRRVVPTKKSGK